MTAHTALLRGVNVGGKAKVAMAELRDLAARLGLGAPRTLLQSGNLVFESAKSAAALETLLEKHIAEDLGLTTHVMVRNHADLAAAIAANPFPAEAKDDPGHLLVVFLKDAVDHAAVDALQASIKGRETVKAVGRHAYIVYPDGVGTSRLTMPAIEKALGVRGTGRNWNTLGKLAAATKG